MTQPPCYTEEMLNYLLPVKSFLMINCGQNKPTPEVGIYYFTVFLMMKLCFKKYN